MVAVSSSRSRVRVRDDPPAGGAGWTGVERSTMIIAGRANDSLGHGQGIGDRYRIHATAQRDGPAA